MSKVFVGGVGCCNGGRLERSRDKDLEEPRRSMRGREGEEGVDVGDCDPDILSSVCLKLLDDKSRIDCGEMELRDRLRQSY